MGTLRMQRDLEGRKDDWYKKGQSRCRDEGPRWMYVVHRLAAVRSRNWQGG